MAKTLTLKTDNKPSYINKDTLLGALIGSTVPFPGGMLVGGLVGGAVGGYLGNNRLESEAKEGKQVSEGSFWNKDTAIGSLIGLKVGVILAIGALAVSFGVAGFGLSDLASGGAETIGKALEESKTAFNAVLTGMAAAGLALVSSPVIGGIIGGRSGKNRQNGEYAQALAQENERELAKAQSKAVEAAPSVSLAHEAQHAQEQTTVHAARIEAERLSVSTVRSPT